MKKGGGHFAPELGGHFELESGGHFKLELGGQYHWNLHFNAFNYNLNRFLTSFYFIVNFDIYKLQLLIQFN
jgi:hypothetical protein